MSTLDSTWWKSLEPAWQVAIRKAADFRTEPKATDFPKIPKIEKLFVEVTGNNLHELGRFTKLKSLGLKSVTGGLDLTPLLKMKQLEYLKLEGQVDDVSLLATIKTLRRFDCYETKVKSLKSFATLAQLEKLDLYGSSASDLKPLAGLKNLKMLRLGNCPDVSDIKPLASLSNLESLDLGHTSVVDLSPVKKMKNLKHLYLEGMDRKSNPNSKKIKEQIAAFAKDCPHLHISIAD
ncbi:MAG: hypothetical protein U1F27_09330 [Turneriella sp.]